MTQAKNSAEWTGWFWRKLDRLGIRFALVMAAALLPLGVVTLIQTKALQSEIQRRTEVALLGQTVRSAGDEIGAIRNAQGIVAALAAALSQGPSPTACAELMRKTALTIPQASLVAFLPKDGMMTCSSNGRTHNFAGNPLFESTRDGQAPGFVVNRNGPVSGTSVLGVSHPVFDAAGVYQGYVSVSLPHTGLGKLDHKARPDLDTSAASVVFWTFDRDGDVLTASSGLDAAIQELPRGRPLGEFVLPADTVFQGTSNAGILRTYAVVPIVEGELYLMSSWDTGSGAQEGFVWPYLPPISMWIVGLLVAVMASERLVTRHIRVLGASIVQFARGDRELRQSDLKSAPVELRAVAEAFQSMTHTITRGEAELEDSIHQKEVLLREVHHRVKNNLQLIASIMNIQMRKAIAPEAKVLLRGLQERVMSLATIHRGLYQTSGLADVRADELFRDIVRQIVNLGTTPDRKFAVNLDVDELHLTPDQAVPLSLLLTEAVTNAIKYAGTVKGRPVKITVRLKRGADEFVVMDVINSLAAETKGAVTEDGSSADAPIISAHSGLGTQLLTAFSQQVGGTLTREMTEDTYALSVRFKVKSVQAGELGDDDETPSGAPI